MVVLMLNNHAYKIVGLYTIGIKVHDGGVRPWYMWDMSQLKKTLIWRGAIVMWQRDDLKRFFNKKSENKITKK